jgi:predicted DsbA family dithiol-disulfide isomerase
MSKIKIRVVTDFVCPYCYVSKRILLKAVENKNIEIEWLPYEMTPISAPQVDTYHDPIRKRQYKKALAPACKKYGIEMKLPPKVVPRPYTRNAIKGWMAAQSEGKEERYTKNVLEAYFEEEKNIGKEEVLALLAEKSGLEKEKFIQAVASEKYDEIVEEWEKKIRELIQPTTLPTILIGDTIRLDGGIYSVEQMERFLEEAAQNSGERQQAGAGCGASGCGF